LRYLEEEDIKESKSKGADLKKKEENLKKSERTIFRKIKQMAREGGPILILDSEEVKRYGITDPDGRATYLTLRETGEKKKHLDKIFELLSTGNDIDIMMVLREIKRYGQKYVLYPNQLDILVLNLGNNDPGIIEDLLFILYTHIIVRKINPGNETAFLETLRSLLKQYEEGHETYTQLRGHLIRFLGHYKDKAVSEQLKKDTEAGKLSKFEHDYLSVLTAKVIDEARTELFYLENMLRKAGEIETADVLDRIRSQAASKAEKPIEKEVHWNSVVINIPSTNIKDI
jgi:hypothetical protein